MKKLPVLLLCTFMAFSLAACGGTGTGQATDNLAYHYACVADTLLSLWRKICPITQQDDSRWSWMQQGKGKYGTKELLKN